MTLSSLLDHPVISERYFFPRTDAPAQPFWVDCEDARLACSYHEVDAAAPTVVHFHGNGETVADYLNGFPELLGRMGCNCFLAEFRGYGGSSGAPQLGRMLADVTATIRALPCPEEQVILFGRSVGSLFAVKAIEQHPKVAGLILESAIANPLERLLLRVDPAELGTTAQDLARALRETLDIRKILMSFTKPALILHTRHDGLIDVSHAEELAAWCGGPAELAIFPQGNHNDIMFVNGPRYFGLINQYLANLRHA